MSKEHHKTVAECVGAFLQSSDFACEADIESYAACFRFVIESLEKTEAELQAA